MSIGQTQPIRMPQQGFPTPSGTLATPPATGQAASGTFQSGQLYQSFLNAQQSSPENKGVPNNPQGPTPFSWKRAGKKFLSGVLSPAKAFIDHPLKTTAMAVGGMLLAHLLQVSIAPIVVIGGLLSVFQLGKAVLTARKCYKAGDGQGAENAFRGMGAATTTALLVALANKGGAVTSAESKAAALHRGQPNADNLMEQAGATAKEKNFLGALQENASMLFTKGGWKGMREGVRFSAIRQHVREFEKLKENGLAGFIASLVDDLVLIGFQKQDHQHKPH